MKTVKKFVMDPKTGEVREETVTVLEPGDQVTTAKARNLHKKFAERDRNRAMRKSWFKESEAELGPFIFALFDRTHGPQHSLKEGTYARLAYLATYLDFDQRLAKTRKASMSKKDAEKVLGLSRAEFYRFWGEVTDAKCIKEDEDGTLRLPKKLFIKGRITSKSYQAGFAKVFVRQMRKLYKAVPAKSHRYLGAVFQMLPYISVKFNILCWNPLETDIDKVEPMTLTDFCVLTGRSKSDVTKLRREYQKVKFTMEDGITRWFCAFVRSTVGGQTEREIIVINPRVVFMGEDWRYVEAHIMHFREDEAFSKP